ncbi:aldo/keto reductase [Kouleothrix aurantiaca]|uniref:Aldo/keto reductase n=1 Tax=Kouleothrix aurantiaca TaxID=186479 RepID=A0A0P9H989_9CHLR|nr:aldo/keto reductase [Kouleothrix aurantiaca]
MKYGAIPGVTKPVAHVVQGTIMLSMAERDRSFELLDAVFGQGGTTFDTAHVYGQGDVERTLGAWVNGRGLREQVVIIGKGAHPMQGRQRVTPADIASDVGESLERLGTDYIDLYLLHRDDPSQPVGPIVEVLNEQLRAGKIHAFGGSNWSHTRVAEANAYAAEHNLTPFVASSPNMSLAVQLKAPWEGCLSLSGPDGAEARDWYAAHNMPLFTWSSLAGGFFSGRFKRDNVDSFSTYLDKLCAETYGSEENFGRLDRATQLAGERGISVAQVALAYVLSLPLDIYALVGCWTGAEFGEAVQASEVQLTPDELVWLENG